MAESLEKPRRARKAGQAVAAFATCSCSSSRTGSVSVPSSARHRRRRWSPQVSGTLEAAVSAPVRVVRDAWGIPHIYAQSADDLFFAQGFVQAQDRLFQLDLWRRSVQGRLAEVLGPNFAERDSSTRRMQYRGDPDAEWASYGADTRAIASAFVRGINAWVTRARERPPEEFVVAGWRPEIWSPADLLNRTDAFVDSGDAIAEIARARLSPVVADALRRVGTPPFFAGFAVPPGARLDHPSRRYFVHLQAPGWNVIGATAPWLPGVSIGHNDRIAWQSQPVTVDTQDVYAEKDAPVTAVFNDSLTIRGRKEAFDFTHEFTRHGVIVASDTEHGLVYAVRWSGFEAGGAAELAALALDRAQSWPEFRQALSRWKMPARRFEYRGRRRQPRVSSGGVGAGPPRHGVGGLANARRAAARLYAGRAPRRPLVPGATHAGRRRRGGTGGLRASAGHHRRAAPALSGRPADAGRRRAAIPCRLRCRRLGSLERDERAGSIRIAGQPALLGSRTRVGEGRSGDAGVQRRGGSGTHGVDAHAGAATIAVRSR